MNAIQVLLGLADDVADEVLQAAEALVERSNRVVTQLKWAVAAPFILFLLGMLIGGFGKPEIADRAAQGFMDLAALASCVLFAAVVLNATVIGQYWAWASVALNKLTGDRLPKLEPEKAIEFSRGLLAVVTWVFVVSSIAMFVPLWRSFHWTIVIMVASFALAGMMMSWGFKSPALKKVMAASVGLVVVCGLLQFIPEVKRFGAAQSDKTLAQLDRKAEELEKQTAAIVAREPEPQEVASSDDGANADAAGATEASPVASATIPADIANGHSPNVNAAPPTLPGGTAVDTLSDTQVIQEAEASVATPAPRVSGETARQIDDLYGDLL
jgi:hypothetical protein